MTLSSRQLAERFGLNLPADFQAWFDEDGPAQWHGGEFSQALTADQIMDPKPGVLWGGFMLPDTMPVMGNRYGDWLCFRADFQGGIRDWIIWRHGGGDWTIAGSSFSEALIYESVSAIAHGNAPRPSSAAQWAIDRLQRSGAETPFRFNTDDLFADDVHLRLRTMLNWRPTPAALRDQALLALACPFQKLATPLLAKQMSVAWDPDFVRLCFDTANLTDKQAQEIRHRLDADQEDFFDQDWAAAEQAALAALEISDEIGWAYDIAGWACEKRGDTQAAASLYQRALDCSAFSDESVLFRTHWFNSKHGKFCAARLRELDFGGVDDYQKLIVKGSSKIYKKVSRLWLDRGAQAEREQNPIEAYQCYWKAGWDIGFMSLLDYFSLFEAMSRTALTGGAKGLQELALLHQQSILGATR